MTEIHEHLLRRASAAREAARLDAPSTEEVDTTQTMELVSLDMHYLVSKAL